jgi:hypothetical protein
MHPTTTAPASSPPKTSVLINRNFALLFLGQVLSVVGDVVFNTTLILWIAVLLAKGQTWAPLAVISIKYQSNRRTGDPGVVW